MPQPDGEDYDVVVIGGGVLGTAIAARLAASRCSVALLEQADDVAEGASKGNAGIATTHYSPPGTLEATLIGLSWPVLPDICRKLDVPFNRIGALRVAINDEQAARLPAIYDEAVAVGAEAELLTGDEARQLEPLLTPECRRAIHLPNEALIDPMRLTCAYAELAAANGAQVKLSSPVVGFEIVGDRIASVITPRSRIGVRFVVNAAGVTGGLVSSLAGGENLKIWPRKGQYWILDREFGRTMQKIVLPVPLAHTKGIQVVPTTNGSVLLGPDAKDIGDPDDKSTDAEGLEAIVAKCRELVPSIPMSSVIKSYAANRSACEESVRVRFDSMKKNLLQVGNRSSGVSASPATAELAAKLLGEAGLDVERRGDAVDSLPTIRRLLFDPDPSSLPDLDPRYSQVVCVCEQVTAAEIAAAFDGALTPHSIEGVRKRTRATAGRCQGSVCMVGVAFLCSLHTGLEPSEIRVASHAGTLGVGHEP